MIRETRNDELPELLALYPAALPEEDLAPLVNRLIAGEATTLSLGAYRGGQLYGHILFTVFDGAGAGETLAGALLGPLCVLPESQGCGLGSALVNDGCGRLASSGIRQVFVLGDPAYYRRFGFQPERRVLPPYELPAQWRDAWQSLVLEGATPLTAGQCRLPGAWLDPALWLP